MSEFRRRLMGASRKGSTIDMPNYMTIEALENGLTAKLTRTDCEYSIDGGEWVSLAANTETPSINAGHIISFKANNPSANATYGIGTFTIGKKCNLKGNCMSMLAYDDAVNMTTVKMHGFRTLFKNCTNIISVEKGFLPATTLNTYCYYQMFYGCSSLVNTPDLAAKTLKNYCYYGMFYDCVSLTQAPELPATTLASNCYYGIFYGCSKLETPPVVAASKLSGNACRDMFNGCTSLISTPSMNIKTVSTYSCYNMFNGCTNLISINITISASTFYSYSCRGMFSGCTKLADASSLFDIDSNAVLDEYCFAYMFSGCGELIEAPLLPSLNLAVECYSNMFANCSSLINVPELPATTLAQGCYYRMFFQCQKIESVALPALELVEDCYGQMFYGCKKLRYIKALFLTTPSTTYTSQWVYGVYQNYGTFAKNIDATWDVSGENGIPNNWTVVSGNDVIINLNGQWAKNDSISPDTSLYDAYESVSNVGVNNSEAIMYIIINGPSSFRLYLRSDAESSYDYAMVSQLNATIDRNTETTSSDVRADTKGNQQSGTSLSSYLIVDYDNIPNGDNVITVVYRKDSTKSYGTDKAYVLIPK